MLSVKNSGGQGGGGHQGLTLKVCGMYYPEGTTSGEEMERQQIYLFYNILPVILKKELYEGYQEVTIDPTRNGGTS